jgi:hypothetical protein
MSSILHLFSEDVGRVDLAVNMLHRKSFILNPFANRIFLKLNVAGVLCGHIVGPLNACLIVVVECSSGINILQVVSILIMLQQRFWKSTTFFDVALVALISASQELREV